MFKKVFFHLQLFSLFSRCYLFLFENVAQGNKDKDVVVVPPLFILVVIYVTDAGLGLAIDLAK
jgi:hypothetical protein